MTQYGRVIGLGLLVLSISACSREGRTQQERIAILLRDGAIRCLADVRDKDEKYEKSENCRSLRRILRPRRLTVWPRAQEEQLGGHLLRRGRAIRV